MGLLVPTYTVPNFGMVLTDAYVALAKNTVVLQPDRSSRGTFNVISNYGVWASQAARDQGASALCNLCVSIVYETSGVHVSDLYAALYAAIKLEFPDATDVLDQQPAAPEPVTN